MTRRLPMLPSASHHDLAEHCVFPWNGGVRWPDRAPMAPEQRYGSALHALAEALVRDVGAEAAEIAVRFELPPADARRLEDARAQLLEVLHADASDHREAEVPFVYAIATGTVRRAASHKDRGAGEVYGAADLVFLRADGLLVARDWKTGQKARRQRPSETRQLRFLGFAAALERGVDRVRLELALVGEDGVEIVGEDLDALELGAVEGELLELVERLEAPPEPRPGPWCAQHFCPIRAVCPATLAALARVEKKLERWPLLGEITSAEHAAYNRHRVAVLREFLDARERQIETFTLHNGPLPVEGRPGVVWGPREHEGRERIEASSEAMAIVEARLGADGARIAIERSMSKASLERAIRADLAELGAAKRGACAARLVPLLDELRAVKAVKKGPRFTRFEEFRMPAKESLA